MKNKYIVCKDCNEVIGSHEEICLGAIFDKRKCASCEKLIEQQDEWHWVDDQQLGAIIDLIT